MPQVNRIKGGALLTALFIMTLVAIVATAMSTKIQLDIYRTKLVITHDKLYLASQAVRFWAMNELNNKEINFTKANSQGRVSQYPKNRRDRYNVVSLNGDIFDLQAQFNLNNLENKKSLTGFINLLSATIPELVQTEQAKLALAVNDWLSSYELAHGKDAYLSYYMSQKPPYYPGHQLMGSKSELRLVKDVSTSIYSKLEPYITALPETTPININTAPIQVLKSLSTISNDAYFNELIMARKKNGIKDLGKITELLKKLNISNDQITLESKYFLSVAYVSSENHSLTVYTLLKRTRDKKGNLSVSILRESFNVF